jgi:hypothetical protein
MSKKLPRGTLDRLWSDPAHWRWLGIYSCKKDPRIIVPKKIKRMGWTMNFAHAGASLALVLVLLASTVPVIYLKSVNDPMGIVVFLTLWTIALVVACGVMSSSRRYED